MRFGYVGIDGGYGKDSGFLRGIDNLGHTFVADVHCRQMIYREDPMPHIPVWNGRGRQPKQLKAQSEAIRVDQWASEQPDTIWRRTRLRDGEKGKLEAQVSSYPRLGVGRQRETATSPALGLPGGKSAQAQ